MNRDPLYFQTPAMNRHREYNTVLCTTTFKVKYLGVDLRKPV